MYDFPFWMPIRKMQTNLSLRTSHTQYEVCPWRCTIYGIRIYMLPGCHSASICQMSMHDTAALRMRRYFDFLRKELKQPFYSILHFHLINLSSALLFFLIAPQQQHTHTAHTPDIKSKIQINGANEWANKRRLAEMEITTKRAIWENERNTFTPFISILYENNFPLNFLSKML